jgi:hypothetical protein
MDGLERGAKGHAERRVARRAGKASLPEDREERMEQRAWNRRSWLALAGAVSRREYEAGDLFEDADLA